MIVAHATRVDIDGAAVLLRGPFAAGKYDLALRMIDAGAKLVADDQMQLVAVRGELIASAPAQLSEKMEVCGLGIFDLGDSQLLPRARVALVADLGPSADVARLPHRTARLVGSTIPMFRSSRWRPSSPRHRRKSERR